MRRGALERIEDAYLVFRCDAGPRVTDRDGRQFALMAYRQRDRTVLRELDGIADQVDDNLPQPLGIAMHMRRQGTGDAIVKRQPTRRRQRAEHAYQVVQHALQRHGVMLEPQFAGLDP
ncbi:hypothetical protein D3C71_1840710 [compost metagenome]